MNNNSGNDIKQDKSVSKFNDDDFYKLIADKAQEVADNITKDRFVNTKKKDEYGKEQEISIDKYNKFTQIRRYYDELLKLSSKAEDEKTDFNRILPAVYLIASQCAYARGKDLVGDYFYAFIKEYILAIKNKEDLNRCVMFMEAVLGYYRMLNPKDK